MRGHRLAVAGLLLTGASLAGTGIAAAQTATTTTIPPVPSLPVTGSTTATTARPASTTATTAPGTSGDLASTGVAADSLVPAGIALIGLGGVMQVASRRPRRDLGLL